MTSPEYNILGKLDLIEKEKKLNIWVQQGFKQYRKKNEKEYIDEIEIQTLTLLKNKETMKIQKTHFNILKMKQADLIKKLLEENQKKANSILILEEQEIISQFGINEIKNLKIDSDKEILRLQTENREKDTIIAELLKKCEAYYAENIEKDLIIIKREKELRTKCENYVIHTRFLKRAHEILMQEKTALEITIDGQRNKSDEDQKKRDEEKKKSDEEKRCCICYEHNSTHACFPCGHKKFCEECINELEECALCKSPIEESIKIFE